MRTNNLFEREYLKLISQQTALPQSTCKECGKHFLNVEPGAECPDCKNPTIPFDAADEDSKNYPTADAEETADDASTIEECGDGEDCSEIEECGDGEDCSEIEECGDGEDCSEIEECGNETDILEEDDFKLDSECNGDDSDIFSEDDTTNMLGDDDDDDNDLVEEDDEVDDQAAESDEEDEDAEETDEEDEDAANEASISDSKIVSFTSADPAVLEVFEKVQAGELKLVAVPLDFKFAEEDKNQNPDLTIDVLQNFDIEDVSEGAENTEDAKGVEGAEGAEGTEGEETEVNPQDDEVKAAEKQQLAKESKPFKRAKYVINQPLVQGKRPTGPKKYGPY